ncbi:hypothetical protein [Ferrovibrio xuzhouensis]|uniref:Uncharacterized protein n=1 Tax=Ferrovibrio xuzhouensis TaxID=1576914 RepID=A0ABV7VCA3_9PROT
MDHFEGEAAGCVDQIIAAVRNGCSRDFIAARLANRMRAAAQAWQHNNALAPRPASTTAAPPTPETDHAG